jgi:hypothetical protein
MGKAFGRTLGDFRQQFMQTVWDKGRLYVVGGPTPAQRKLFDERFGGLWYSMQAADWFEMPDLLVRDITVELDPGDSKMVDSLARALLSSKARARSLIP